MKRWITILLAPCLLAGCGTKPISEAKQEAYHRWHHTRAQVVCEVAAEQLRVGQLDLAGSKVREALALDGEYLPARILLGKVLLEKGEYIIASAQLTELAGDVPESAEIHYLLGAALEKEGRLDEALNSYRRSHQLDEKNPAPVAAVGEVLVALDRLEEAQLYMESYITPAASEPTLHELAGRVAMMRCQYEKAATYYEQAADIDRRNVKYR